MRSPDPFPAWCAWPDGPPHTVAPSMKTFPRVSLHLDRHRCRCRCWSTWPPPRLWHPLAAGISTPPSHQSHARMWPTPIYCHCSWSDRDSPFCFPKLTSSSDSVRCISGWLAPGSWNGPNRFCQCPQFRLAQPLRLAMGMAMDWSSHLEFRCPSFAIAALFRWRDAGFGCGNRRLGCSITVVWAYWLDLMRCWTHLNSWLLMCGPILCCPDFLVKGCADGRRRPFSLVNHCAGSNRYPDFCLAAADYSRSVSGVAGCFVGCRSSSSYCLTKMHRHHCPSVCRDFDLCPRRASLGVGHDDSGRNQCADLCDRSSDRSFFYRRAYISMKRSFSQVFHKKTLKN